MTTSDRCSTRGSGKCQFERRITDDVRSRSPANQAGAEGAMDEAADNEAEQDALSGRQEADCGGTESTVGEGETRSLVIW